MKDQSIDVNKKKWYSRLSFPKPLDSIIIFILNILLTIPIFIIIHQNILDPNWPFQLDRIALFIGILIVLQLILRLLKTFLILCIIAR